MRPNEMNFDFCSRFYEWNCILLMFMNLRGVMLSLLLTFYRMRLCLTKLKTQSCMRYEDHHLENCFGVCSLWEVNGWRGDMWNWFIVLFFLFCSDRTATAIARKETVRWSNESVCTLSWLKFSIWRQTSLIGQWTFNARCCGFATLWWN